MTISVEEYANIDDSELLKKIKGTKWDDVQNLLATEDGKDMTKMQDSYGNLPLHAAVGFRAPDSVILSLLDMNPDAARVHGTDYWLPLHIAAMWGVTPTVLNAIIRANPLALDDPGEPGIKGRTPRHFSGRFSHNKEALERSTEEWLEIIHAEKNQCV